MMNVEDGIVKKFFVMKKMLVHIFMNYLSLTNNISNTHLNRLNSD